MDDVIQQALAESQEANRPEPSLTDIAYGDKMGVPPEQAREAVLSKAIEQQRQKFQGRSPLEQAAEFVTPAMPFGSIPRAKLASMVKDASDRVSSGTYDNHDLGLVAMQHVRDEAAGKQSFGRQVLGILPQAAGVLGETYLGGGALGAVAPAVRVGGLVPRLAVAGTGLAARTAVQPSMYAEQAQQRANANGGSATDFKNLAPAFAEGMIQTAILGRLGETSKGLAGVVPTRAGRTGANVLLGSAQFMGESQAADTVTSLVDQVLPDALQSKTKYGTLGELARGEDGAMRRAALKAITGAVFSAVHSTDVPDQRKAVAQAELENYQAKLLSLGKRGLSRERVAQELMQHIDARNRAIQAEDRSAPPASNIPAQAPAAPPSPDQAQAAPSAPQAPIAPPGANGAIPENGNAGPVPTPAPGAPGAQAPAAPPPPPAPPKPHENRALLAALVDAGVAKTQKHAADMLEKLPPEAAADMQRQFMGQPAAPAPSPAGPVYHVVSATDRAKSVDSTISMLEGGSSTPGGNLDVWTGRDKADSYSAPGGVTLQWDGAGDRLDASRGNKGIANLKGAGKLATDPHLTRVEFKGEGEGPQYAKLHQAIEAANAKRTGLGLKPIQLDPTRKAAPKVEGKSPEWQAAYEDAFKLFPDDGFARAQADKAHPEPAGQEPPPDQAARSGPPDQAPGSTPAAPQEPAAVLKAIADKSPSRQDLIDRGYRNLLKSSDLFKHGYSVSHWIKPGVPGSEILEFNPRTAKGDVDRGLPRLVIDNRADQESVHRALGLTPEGEKAAEAPPPEAAAPAETHPLKARGWSDKQIAGLEKRVRKEGPAGFQGEDKDPAVAAYARDYAERAKVEAEQRQRANSKAAARRMQAVTAERVGIDVPAMAKELGVSEDVLHSIAADIMSRDREINGDRNEMLRSARESLTRRARKRGRKSFKGDREEDMIRESDDVGRDVAGEFPGLLGGAGYDPDAPDEDYGERLTNEIDRGKSKDTRLVDAYEQARREIEHAKELRDAHGSAQEEHSPAEIDEALRSGEEDGFAEREAAGQGEAPAQDDGPIDTSFDFGANASEPEPAPAEDLKPAAERVKAAFIDKLGELKPRDQKIADGMMAELLGEAPKESLRALGKRHGLSGQRVKDIQDAMLAKAMPGFKTADEARQALKELAAGGLRDKAKETQGLHGDNRQGGLSDERFAMLKRAWEGGKKLKEADARKLHDRLVDELAERLTRKEDVPAAEIKRIGELGKAIGAGEDSPLINFNASPLANERREVNIGGVAGMFAGTAGSGNQMRETALANERVDQLRMQRGEPPLMRAARKAFGAAWDAAMSKLQADPQAARRLVDELAHKTRPISDDEGALLMHRQVVLHNEFERATNQLALDQRKSFTEGADAETAQKRKAQGEARLREVNDQLDQLDQVTKAVGTQNARALAIRAQMVKENFSLASIIRQAAAAKGSPLTEAERAELTALHAEVDRLQKRYDESEARREADAKARAEAPPVEPPAQGTKEAGLWRKATDWLKKIFGGDESGGPGQQRGKLWDVADRWEKEATDELSKKLSGKLFSGFDPELVVPLSKYVAAKIIKTGYTFAEFSKAIVDRFGEDVKPHVSEIWDRAQKMTSPPDQKAGISPAEPYHSRELADLERGRQKINAVVMEKKFRAKPFWERAADYFAAYQRGNVLSGFGTLQKLTSAAVQRMVLTPVEELAGAAIGKLAPGLASRAPREGGFSFRAEAKAFTSFFTSGMRDAKDILRTGKTDLDVTYGDNRRLQPPNLKRFMEVFGLLHGALKAPVKRAEFERSLQKRAEFAIRNGVDVSNPGVQMAMGVAAYKDANRAIFLQDNALVDGYNKMLARWEKPDAETGRTPVAGKLAATAARTALPVVRVPTNIVAEVLTHAFGSVTGSVQLARAYARGIDGLKPNEADSIMRQLKKGSLGAAVLALGYLGASNLGGQYMPGRKRDEADIKPGEARIFGVDVPKDLLHHPLLETAQVGAAARRAADAGKKGQEPNGPVVGTMKALLGLADEVPFVRETADIEKARRDPAAWAAGQAKRLTVPIGVQQLAGQLDRNSQGEKSVRKVDGLGSSIQSGVPGLRNQLPDKQAEDDARKARRGRR